MAITDTFNVLPERFLKIEEEGEYFPENCLFKATVADYVGHNTWELNWGKEIGQDYFVYVELPSDCPICVGDEVIIHIADAAMGNVDYILNGKRRYSNLALAAATAAE